MHCSSYTELNCMIIRGKTCHLRTKCSGADGFNSTKAQALSLCDTGSSDWSSDTGSSIKTAVKNHKIQCPMITTFFAKHSKTWAK